jgi:predicted membrane protein
MENQNNNEVKYQSNKVWVGLFIIVVGALLLLDNFGLNLPNWLFTWSTFVFALGVIIGYKHNFRGGGWFIMMLIGAYFTLDEALGRQYDMSHIAFPIMLVAVGLFIIFKPKSEFKRNNKWKRRGDRWKQRFEQPDITQSYQQEEMLEPNGEKRNTNDYVDSVNVFGGSNQTVYSKNFKGGEITAIFGGCDVNLTHADFTGEVVIDITAICGGAKIVLPAGWKVKHEVTAIFGGLDDKRSILPNVDTDKLLIVRGIALFGGVDIRNY